MAVSDKRMTFNREFREARAQFKVNPTEKNFTFTSTVDGGKKTVLKKGETKQSLTKKFKSEGSLNKPAASAKPANSMPGYLKRQATGKKRVVKDDTLADVTKKELTSWKAKNKGRYKGKALTAYLNNKGRNIPSTVSEKEPAVILESFVKTEIAPELSAVMAKLEKKLKGARSKAEARGIIEENTSKAFSPSRMNAMLKKLEETGMFKFKPAQPKPAVPIKKTAPKAAKPNRKVIQTKKRIISNAAIKKFMRKEYPERLSRIEIGDTVFFRTNAAGEPVVASILKKGK